ncbi:shTK domain protein [Oesophagostomum dentatum]|uniref:Metalloendopeptidase n=1 Tax=Oesophagostomum dentatum TaxID=61180 RepID=A0A0B1T0E3_OESDE|nr:shTK domain protein [Oesophagostomum dentatum]
MLVTSVVASLLLASTHGLATVSVPSKNAKFVKDLFDDYSEKFLLPEDFANAAEKPVDIPTEAQLDAVQNSQLFEGDIMGMPTAEDEALRRLRDEPVDIDEADIFGRPYHSALNLVTYPEKLWTDAEVPYMLEEGMTNDQRAAIAQAFDEYKEKTCVRFVPRTEDDFDYIYIKRNVAFGQRAAIAQAFDEYKEKTCVRFVPRTEDDFDYIYIKRNVAFGCSSYVGRAGGNQTVSLEVDKCFSKGIIAHELMHALGFFHEHSRTDRDQFVDINEDNIRPGMLRNFEKYPRKIIDPLGMPYDYDSVMHYHKLAFSRNGKPTIVPKDGKAEVGQRYKLSEIDSKKITKTKRPTTTTTKKTTTKAPTTKAPVRIKKRCEDLNAHCGMWEQLGHCQHSTKYMAHYCRKSCGMCDDDIPQTTTKPSVKEREKGGTSENKENKEKEKKPDDKEICKDKNLFCGYWAKIGECKSESKFMKIFCKASCGRC